MSGSELDFVERLNSGRIVPPREVCSKVPRALEAICLKATRVNPQERHRTAKELAADPQWGDELDRLIEKAQSRITTIK